MISKAEKTIHHFVFNNKGNYLALNENIKEETFIVCIESEQKSTCLYKFVCKCRRVRIAFCMNHAKTGGKVCDVSYHYGSILQEYDNRHISSSMDDLQKWRKKNF